MAPRMSGARHVLWMRDVLGRDPMNGTAALARLTDQPLLDQIAEPLSRAVRDGYALAGPAGQRAKNALHGVWLHHPLHPVFTDVPLGAWTTGLVLDAVAARTNEPAME